MRRLSLVLVLAAALVAPTAANAAFTRSDRLLPMDDGVSIATTTFRPDGAGPFPAIVMFHGIGGKRQDLDSIAGAYADAGYVVLTSDFRGHGQSGGLFSGLGPRELADAAALRERWLPQLAPVDQSKVGAWGISLGGGAVLRSITEGEPYAAATVYETWTDLYDALVPQGLPKTGAIFGFLNSVAAERRAPELLALQEAIARRDVEALQAFGASRSTKPLLGRGFPPTLFVQGRRDFAFGLEQGIDVFRGLTAPKALLVANIGHAPSSFDHAPDLQLVIARSIAWYDRYLKGSTTAPPQAPVELSPDPFRGATTRFQSLPATSTLVYGLRGTTTIGAAGKAVRRVLLRRPRTETFGAPTVRVALTPRGGWSHLVAVLVARKGAASTLVSEGGAPIGPQTRAVTIRLISQATTIPAGARLELTLAATSTAQDVGNLLYLIPVPVGARLTIRSAELRVPILRKRVSRLLLGLRPHAAAPGVTRTSIVIGGTGPLSGPEVAYAGVLLGAQAYFKYVNDHGGVFGRKIDYRIVDDAYDPSRTIQATRKLVQQDGVFAMFNMVGTEQNLAVRPYLNAAKVPQVFGGTGLRAIGRDHRRYPWTMGYLPSFYAEGRLDAQHLSRTKRRAKVAVLYEASDYGRDLLAGFRSALRGPRVVATTTYEVTDTDLSSQLAQLKRSGADVLVLFSLPKQTIGGLLAASRLGWRPTTYVSAVSVDPAVMRIVQTTAGRQAGEKAITVAWMKDASNPAIAKDPAIKLYKQIMRRYLSGRSPDEVVHLYGMAVAYSFVQALKAAGRNPTRESLLRAATHLNHQVPFMTKGIRVKTSPTDYFPISRVRFLRYERGYWRQFGGLVSASD